MRYKNPKDQDGKPKTRELRRLYEVEIFLGDREDPEVETALETVVAWNEPDAIRRTGDRAVKQPKMICWVTWPEYAGGPIYRINSPQEGPLRDAPIVPTVPLPEATEEDWGF